jgi:hypothetical protein
MITGTSGTASRIRASVAPPDVVALLQRIENAVESVAIEVERIAEAQRFSAKLQAEQAQRALPATRSDS